ncbi:MAG: hypothetical protein ACR2G7_05620 [Acidimicrobiales bacterium]
MSRGKIFLAVLGSLALVATACGDDNSTDTSASSTTAAPTATTQAGVEDGDVQAVKIVADDYKFTDVPTDLKAGVVKLSFENKGKVDHEVALVEIGDTPLDQFLKEFPPVLEGGPFPAYAENVAAPIEIGGGETTEVTFTIAEGTYALMCTLDGDAEVAASTTTDPNAAPGGPEDEKPQGPPHFDRGMAQVLTVGPGQADAALPKTDGSITAKDYGFDVDVKAGDKTITYVNDGPNELHFASISVFPEGTDAAAAEDAFKQFLQAGEDSPPPEGLPMPEDVGFSGIFSAGLGDNFQMMQPFESGRTYLVTCFLQDRAGGPPHAIGNQMYKVFTVG